MSIVIIVNNKTWSEIEDYNILETKKTKLIFSFILKYFGSLIICGSIITDTIE